MIDRLIRLARPTDPTRQGLWADVEDAVGVVSLFVLLFLGLTLSGSV